MPHRPSAILVFSALVVLVATACGSTLPQASQEAGQLVDDGFGGGATGALPPGARINSKGQVVNAEGEVIGRAEDFGLSTGGEGIVAAGSSRRSSGSSSPRKAGSTSLGTNGPGVTKDSITLGLFNSVNGKAASESIGLELGSFSYKRGWEALIKWQNAHGGVAGRRIKPVFYTFDVSSSQTWTQQEQEECTTFTEDAQVFAALTGVFSTNILECMHEAGGVVTSMDRAPLSVTPIYGQYPYFIEPVAIALDRAAEVMVHGLHSMRYFGEDSKLGVVTFDDPGFKYAVEESLQPALRRRGLPAPTVAYIHRNQNVSEVAQTSNDATNAALRFKTEGITHVIFIDNGGAAAYWFTQAAARQDFHPRYGLSSQSAPQVLARGLGDDARSQFHDAVGVGWVPIYDVREEDDPHAKSPTRVLCLSIMRKAGVEMTGSGMGNALLICDALWSTAAALDGVSVINQATYLAGMHRLRGSFAPGGVWSTYLAPTAHDGVSSVANMRFVDDCACFRYVGQPYRVL